MPRPLPRRRAAQAPSWRPTAPPPQAATATPTTSALDGAARATPARQLPPGAAQAYPEARPLAPVAATRPQLQNGGSPAILSTAAAEPTSNAYIRGPRARPSTQATSFYPPSAPNTQQSTSGSFLPRLRSVRSPPQSSAVRRNQGLPHPSNATVRLPSTVRSRPASKLRSGATTAQIPNHARSLRRREARRR